MFLNLFAYGKYKSFDDLESCIQYCFRYIYQCDFSLRCSDNVFQVFENDLFVGSICYE